MGTLLISFLFLLSACRAGVSAASDKTEAQGPSKSEKMSSGKMTLGGTQEGQALQLGINISLQNVDDKTGMQVAKAFEEQLNVFEVCVTALAGTKEEALTLKAQFEVAKKGVLSNVKVMSMEPKSPDFSACFMKQSQQVDLGPQAKILKGQLTLGTFHGGGDRPKWGLEGKRVKRQ